MSTAPSLIALREQLRVLYCAYRRYCVLQHLNYKLFHTFRTCSVLEHFLAKPSRIFAEDTQTDITNTQCRPESLLRSPAYTLAHFCQQVDRSNQQPSLMASKATATERIMILHDSGATASTTATSIMLPNPRTGEQRCVQEGKLLHRGGLSASDGRDRLHTIATYRSCQWVYLGWQLQR